MLLNLLANAQTYLMAVNAVCVAFVGLFILIPGDQPESFLQKIVDAIASMSRK